MSEQDAYFAGLIDGEGSITMNKRGPNQGYRAVIKVKMTDRDIIYALLERYGGNVYQFQPPNIKHKLTWAWHAESRVARETLPRIYPFLRVKRAAADLMFLYFAQSRQGKKTIWPPPK